MHLLLSQSEKEENLRPSSATVLQINICSQSKAAVVNVRVSVACLLIKQKIKSVRLLTFILCDSFTPGELGVQRVGEEGSPSLSCRHHAGQLPHQPAPHVPVQCCHHGSEQREQLCTGLLWGRPQDQVLGGEFTSVSCPLNRTGSIPGMEIYICFWVKCLYE